MYQVDTLGAVLSGCTSGRACQEWSYWDLRPKEALLLESSFSRSTLIRIKILKGQAEGADFIRVNMLKKD